MQQICSYYVLKSKRRGSSSRAKLWTPTEHPLPLHIHRQQYRTQIQCHLTQYEVVLWLKSRRNISPHPEQLSLKLYQFCFHQETNKPEHNHHLKVYLIRNHWNGGTEKSPMDWAINQYKTKSFLWVYKPKTRVKLLWFTVFLGFYLHRASLHFICTSFGNEVYTRHRQHNQNTENC